MADESLTEDDAPELVQFAEPMPTLPPDTQELFDLYKAWVEEHKPGEFIEKGDEEGYERLKKMKPEYIATDHDTCENSWLDVGIHEFSPTNCCWHEHGWYILEVPGEVDDYVEYSNYDVCVECNAGGDDDGDPECENCEGDGWKTYYFDEYV